MRVVVRPDHIVREALGERRQPQETIHLVQAPDATDDMREENAVDRILLLGQIEFVQSVESQAIAIAGAVCIGWRRPNRFMTGGLSQ